MHLPHVSCPRGVKTTPSGHSMEIGRERFLRPSQTHPRVSEPPRGSNPVWEPISGMILDEMIWHRRVKDILVSSSELSRCAALRACPGRPAA